MRTQWFWRSPISLSECPPKSSNRTKSSDQPFSASSHSKKPKVDSIGVIKVYMDKKSTLRILVTATVTVIDMISNIGGTLGLFCGFSILSGVEILYWVGKVLAKKRTY